LSDKEDADKLGKLLARLFETINIAISQMAEARLRIAILEERVKKLEETVEGMASCFVIKEEYEGTSDKDES